MTFITIEVLRSFFLWLTIVNFAMMILSFIIFASAKDFIYKVHTTWFKISTEKFHSSIYKAFAYYKFLIIGLNLAPYVALSII